MDVKFLDEWSGMTDEEIIDIFCIDLRLEEDRALLNRIKGEKY